MNTVFFICVFVSMLLLLGTAPAEILPALSRGTQSAVSLCLSLTASFALWGGLSALAKEAGANRGLARLLRRPVGLLLGKTDEKTTEEIAANLSANFLGLGAIATPKGIAAVRGLLQGAGENTALFERQTSMLLILNACCMQLLPTSVISLRLSLGSSTPADIWIPTLFTGLFSTLSGVIACAVWNALAARKERLIKIRKPRKVPCPGGGKSNA